MNETDDVNPKPAADVPNPTSGESAGGGKIRHQETSKPSLTAFPDDAPLNESDENQAFAESLRDRTVHPFRDMTVEERESARSLFAAVGMDEAEMLLVGFLAGLEAGGTISGRWWGHPPEAETNNRQPTTDNQEEHAPGS